MLEYKMLSWVKRVSFKYLEGLVAVFFYAKEILITAVFNKY